MKKRTVIGVVAAGIVLLGAISNGGGSPSQKLDTVRNSSATTTSQSIPKKAPLTCDGTAVTNSCTLDGTNYKTYVYHAAIAEKNHTETVTTYREEVTGYCTLCSDGTYSPSCATGRGACSHHGGVAQWNAPRTTNVPVYSNKTIVDTPAQEAYYEKVTE